MLRQSTPLSGPEQPGSGPQDPYPTSWLEMQPSDSSARRSKILRPRDSGLHGHQLQWENDCAVQRGTTDRALRRNWLNRSMAWDNEATETNDPSVLRSSKRRMLDKPPPMPAECELCVQTQHQTRPSSPSHDDTYLAQCRAISGPRRSYEAFSRDGSALVYPVATNMSHVHKPINKISYAYHNPLTDGGLVQQWGINSHASLHSLGHSSPRDCWTDFDDASLAHKAMLDYGTIDDCSFHNGLSRYVSPKCTEPRILSYPERILQKANALYSVMLCEAQRICTLRLSTGPRARQGSGIDVLVCLEALRLPGQQTEWNSAAQGASVPHTCQLPASQQHSGFEHPYSGITAMSDDSVRPALERAPPTTKDSTQWTISSELPRNLQDSARQTYRDLAYLVQWDGSVSLQAGTLCGCFALILGDNCYALSLFRRLATGTPCPTALSNLALVLLLTGSSRDAELYWRKALEVDHRYLDAAEHLATLLCSQKHHRKAIEMVDSVLQCLQSGVGCPSSPYHPMKHHFNPSPVPEVCISRLIGLVHAKANALYALHDNVRAAMAFDTAISLAAGLPDGSSINLVRMVMARLSAYFQMPRTSDLLLLDPHEACISLQACFGQEGTLPGLRSIARRGSLRKALALTSNCILSFAKIHQDTFFTTSQSKTQLPQRFSIPEILTMYYLSLSIQPSASTANNVGILLASLNHFSNVPTHSSGTVYGQSGQTGTALALQYYQYGISLDPYHAHLYTNLGSLLKDMGRLDEAISLYEQGVACDPKFDIALANLANAVKDQGRTDEAVHYYERAIAVNPTFVEAVCGLANTLGSICAWDKRGGLYTSEGKYDRWHVDAYGRIFDVQGVTQGSGWLQRVSDIVDEQLLHNARWGVSHLGKEELHRLLQQILTCIPSHDHSVVERFFKQAHTWCGSKIVRLIERATRQIHWTWYHDRYSRGCAKPRSSYSRPRALQISPAPVSPTVLPFHTFTLPFNAQRIRSISQSHAIRLSHSTLKAAWLPATVFPPPPPPSPTLNVGYVSSDFNNHPLSHLMQSIFGFHNKTQFRVICYATTPSDGSIYRHKIQSEASAFHDTSTWSTQQILQQILSDSIHILINLNGYTRGARNDVFAARPAPIQMSFMGYAGSLGAEWCDYLLADPIAVPPSTLRPHRSNVSVADIFTEEGAIASSPPTVQNSWIYTENLIYTRTTFFCCDHLQAASSASRTRTWPAELTHRRTLRTKLFGTRIPPGAPILANFNQLYKIDPTTFRTWLRILARCPSAYLWLLRFPAAGEANLLRYAHSWATPEIASRIVFTDVAPKDEHIERGCVADLFLDTPECNAHTTAADCLWSGTPLLTLGRYEWKMCSRIGGSILSGALPIWCEEGRRAWEELCVSSEEGYEEQVVRLVEGLRYLPEVVTLRRRTRCGARKKVGGGEQALDRSRGLCEGRLVELRRMIWEYRWRCPLFDTRRWVRDLEAGYWEAWRRWVRGEGGDIWLEELLGPLTPPKD